MQHPTLSVFSLSLSLTTLLFPFFHLDGALFKNIYTFLY